jgi:hypothetical protein
MTQLNARFKPGENVPVFASAAQILAGRFVKFTAKSTQGDYTGVHCTAAVKSSGVAEYDSAPTTQDANSQERRVNLVRRGAIARVEAGAAVAALAEVESDSVGRAVTLASGAVQGRALTAAAAAGDIIEVDLY